MSFNMVNFLGSLFSFLSLCTSTVMAVGLRRDILVSVSKSKFAFLRLIFSMSLCEALFSVCLLVIFLPSSLGYAHIWNDSESPTIRNICIFTGFLLQLSEVSCFLWFFIIVWTLLVLLKGVPSTPLDRSVCVQNFFVTVGSVLASFIPLFAGAYGPVTDTGTECWIPAEHSVYRMFFYGPVMVNITFALLVLAFALANRLRGGMFQDQPRLLAQIVAFVMVYVGIWAIPCARRLYQFLNTKDQPWLRVGQQLCMSLAGTANFALWTFITKCRPGPTYREDVVDLLSSRTLSKYGFDGDLAGDSEGYSIQEEGEGGGGAGNKYKDRAKGNRSLKRQQLLKQASSSIQPSQPDQPLLYHYPPAPYVPLASQPRPLTEERLQ